MIPVIPSDFFQKYANSSGSSNETELVIQIKYKRYVMSLSISVFAESQKLVSRDTLLAYFGKEKKYGKYLVVFT